MNKIFRNLFSFRCRIKGFSLVELLVVVVIMGILIGFATSEVLNVINQTKLKTLKNNVIELRKQIDKYRGDKGIWPENLEELTRGRHPYFRSLPIDPFYGASIWIVRPPEINLCLTHEEGVTYDGRKPAQISATSFQRVTLYDNTIDETEFAPVNMGDGDMSTTWKQEYKPGGSGPVRVIANLPTPAGANNGNHIDKIRVYFENSFGRTYFLDSLRVNGTVPSDFKKKKFTQKKTLFEYDLPLTLKSSLKFDSIEMELHTEVLDPRISDVVEIKEIEIIEWAEEYDYQSDFIKNIIKTKGREELSPNRWDLYTKLEHPYGIMDVRCYEKRYWSW